jgi:hypothetical protein
MVTLLLYKTDRKGYKMYSITDHVKGPCTFKYYRDNSLWYETHLGLLFNVPINDIDQGTFNYTEKGILMMRWIRKFTESLGN